MLIAFDINDTLLTKIKKTDKEYINRLSDMQKDLLYSFNHVYLLERRYTQELVAFLEEHKIKYIFWSTAMKHNIDKMVRFLTKIGYTSYAGYMSQEDCEEGVMTDKIKAVNNRKNLVLAAQRFNEKEENCVLVDNAVEKSIAGQNFIHIKDADPFSHDDGLLKLCVELDAWIKCDKCCGAKEIMKRLNLTVHE